MRGAVCYVFFFNHTLYLDRKEKRVIDAIKIINLIFSKSLFICNFDWEQPALESFIKNNYEYRYM